MILIVVEWWISMVGGVSSRLNAGVIEKSYGCILWFRMFSRLLPHRHKQICFSDGSINIVLVNDYYDVFFFWGSYDFLCLCCFVCVCEFLYQSSKELQSQIGWFSCVSYQDFWSFICIDDEQPINDLCKHRASYLNGRRK